MPVVKPPPAAAKPKTTRTFAPQKSKHDERLEGLQGLAQVGQAICIAFRQYADAGTIGQYGPGLAEETANLADSQEVIARMVDPIIQTGPYTAMIAILLPMSVQVAVNHGWLKPGALGSVPRETMSARVEAGIARMQAQAYREQMEAQAEAERLQEEIRQAKSVIPASAA